MRVHPQAWRVLTRRDEDIFRGLGDGLRAHSRVLAYRKRVPLLAAGLALRVASGYGRAGGPPCLARSRRASWPNHNRKPTTSHTMRAGATSTVRPFGSILAKIKANARMHAKTAMARRRRRICSPPAAAVGCLRPNRAQSTACERRLGYCGAGTRTIGAAVSQCDEHATARALTGQPP